LKDKLDAFENARAAALPRQPRWRGRAPGAAVPIGATEPTAAKTYITLSWIAGDALNPANRRSSPCSTRAAGQRGRAAAQGNHRFEASAPTCSTPAPVAAGTRGRQRRPQGH